MVGLRSGWSIGRLAGIPIRVHPSFLVLVAFVALGWLGPPASAATWVTLVFGSVVVHELAHALVARRRGFVVRDIVLLPIGGASEIEHLDRRPRDERAVAAAGPLTSVALGASLLLLAALAGFGAGLTSWAGPTVARLGWANVLIGAFNLLPALPMDGGRVLRAHLAARIGIAAATEKTVQVARVVAIAMAAVGLVAPWLLLIAAFVWFGGDSEVLAVRLHERLAPLHVSDVVTPVPAGTSAPAPVTVRLDEPLEDALDALGRASATAATVVNERGVVVGVLLIGTVERLLRAQGC
jgi:stage IV sporulation protein FB